MDKLTTSLTPMDIGCKLNSLQYIIYNMIVDTVNTICVVKVLAVNGDKVDVIPVMKRLSNDNEPIDNTTVKSVMYLKLQAGGNLIDLVPEVGDIGLLLVSKQDTSGLSKDAESVCQTKSVFNLGDGIYLGSIFGYNAEPTQYVKFENNKVTVKGTTEIVIDAPKVTVNAPTANVNASTSATITTAKAVIDSTNILLGGDSATKKIALDGDPVKSGTTVVGNIVASSTTTKGM